MRSTPLHRLDSEDQPALARYFAQGPACPVILTGAMQHWPARQNWTLDRLAATHGGDFGNLWLGFDGASCSKLTSLGEFIAHLDDPLETLPGFWMDGAGKPLRTAPDIDHAQVWSFVWNGLEKHRELRAEIEPYPANVPNMVMAMPRDLYGLTQAIMGRRFHEVYVSRRGTITPIHRDYSSTFGSLAQFDGRKLAILVPPEVTGLGGKTSFNPEQPDFDAFPQMRDGTIFCGELEPGELLIIPPDWWHYTRTLDHAVVLSHNFFNALNFNTFQRNLFNKLAHWGQDEGLARKIASYLPESAPDDAA